MIRGEILRAADEFKIQLDDSQLDQLETFYNLILDWNEKINLTNIIESRDFAIKNVIDSISAFKAIEKISAESISIIDVGTGAGFPSVPLKIFKPDLKFTLLDSLNKRVKFLEAVKAELKFSNFECIHGRAEEFSRQAEFREKFDVAISRAVARLRILSELCLPFVKIDGIFVAMKSKNFLEEINESKNAVKILGGSKFETIDIKLPSLDDIRVLIVSKKVRATDRKYPRNFGKIEKIPL